MGGVSINRILNLLILLILALLCVGAVSATDTCDNATELSTNIEISQENDDIIQISDNEDILNEGEIEISDSQYPDSSTITRNTGSVTLNVRPYVFSSDSDILYLSINGHSQAVSYMSDAKANGITFSFTESGTYDVYAHSESIFGTITSNTLTYIVGGGNTTPIDENKTYQPVLKLYDNESSSTIVYKQVGDDAVLLNNLSNSELGSYISNFISMTQKEGQKAINEFISIYLNGEFIGKIAVSPNGEWANGAKLSFSESGWHNFTAVYEGNEHLLNATSNVLAYYVGVIDENSTEETRTVIEADPLSINLGESALVTPAVYDSENNSVTFGYIDIYVDSKKVAMIGVGESYTLTPTTAGNLSIYAEFLTNPSYKSSKSNITVVSVVSSQPVNPDTPVDTITTIVVNQTKVIYGNSVLITPKVTDKNNNPITSGSVAICINDMNMTSINAGESYEYYPFLPGTYSIKVYYLGNDDFNPSSSLLIDVTVAFEDDPVDDNGTGDNSTDDNSTDDNSTEDNDADKILDTKTTVNVNPATVISGEDIIITPAVTDKNGNGVNEGNVELYIDDMLITTVGIGKAYTVAFTEIGSYNAYAKYLGSEKYGSSISDVIKFRVIEKPSNGTDPVPENPNNDTNITPAEPANDTNTTPAEPANETNNTPSNDTVTVNAVLTADDLEAYYHDESRFYVKLTDDKSNPIANEKILIELNGMNYTRTTNENGSASITINLNSNLYTVNVYYLGSKNYTNCSTNAQINVKPTVLSRDITKIFRNGTFYQATFLDTDGNPVSGLKVTFNINGVFYNRTTDSEGYARLNINLNQGEYIITALNTLTGEKHSNTVTVLPSITDNKDITKYYRNATQYSVRLWGYDGKPVGAGEIVTFNINGVFYNRTTDSNGFAKLNINLAPGKYIITAEYNDCKVSNNITVLSTIESSDLQMTYRDGSKFNVTLLDGQGRPSANQNVTFNINGVFYNRISNSDGVASLNINLQKGEYIITSSYNSLNKSNTITIA